MPLGQIDQQDNIDTSIDTIASTTEQQDHSPESFADIKKATTPENQSLLQDIEENAEENLVNIVPALISIAQAKPGNKIFSELLQIVSENANEIDAGEIKDQRKEINALSHTIQKNKKLTETKKQEEQETAEGIAIQKKLTGEKKQEEQETAEGIAIQKNNQETIKAKVQETIGGQEQMKKDMKEAKEYANKIQSQNSPALQAEQANISGSLQINEDKLADSPLGVDDVTKLMALEQNDSLWEEDGLFASDVNKEEVRSYLSDGSFDSLKQDLGIIDSVDDLASPDAFRQIDGMEDAHEGAFDAQLENSEQSEKFGALAESIVKNLPSITYQEGGAMKVHTIQAQNIMKDMGLQLDDPTMFVKALAMSQQAPSDNQYKALQYTKTTIGKHLHQQTSDTIKDTTKQNYLSHVSSLFGGMGDDMQTDPSRMSYDENGGLKIDFSIDGYDFQHPLKIGSSITGPSIMDKHKGGAMGQETMMELGNMHLTTMDDMIKNISTNDITNANSVDGYRQSLAQFGKKQQSSMASKARTQQIALTRYATKLKTHLTTRTVTSKLNNLGEITEDSSATEGAHLDNQEYQNLYGLISKTTEHNSTVQNKQLSGAMDKINHHVDGFKGNSLSMHGFSADQIEDPVAQSLLNANNDNPQRAQDFFGVFQKQDNNILNTGDLDTYANYIDTMITQQNPSLTFMDYLNDNGKRVSGPTMSSYGDIYHQTEVAQADINLEKSLAAIA